MKESEIPYKYVCHNHRCTKCSMKNMSDCTYCEKIVDEDKLKKIIRNEKFKKSQIIK